MNDEQMLQLMENLIDKEYFAQPKSRCCSGVSMSELCELLWIGSTLPRVLFYQCPTCSKFCFQYVNPERVLEIIGTFRPFVRDYDRVAQALEALAAEHRMLSV